MSGGPHPDMIAAWQGWSGQRYDAAVYRKGSAPPVGADGSVALAISRGGDGVARTLMVDCFGCGMASLGPRAWLKEAKRLGATEVHIISPDAPEQALSIASDLGAEAPAPPAPLDPSSAEQCSWL